MNNLNVSLQEYSTARQSTKYCAITSLNTQLDKVFKSFDILKQKTLSEECKLDAKTYTEKNFINLYT